MRYINLLTYLLSYHATIIQEKHTIEQRLTYRSVIRVQPLKFSATMLRQF